LSLGVAIGALLLNLTLAIKGDGHLGPLDFWPAYLGIAVLSLLSLPFFVTLPPDAGAELSGHALPVATPARHADPA
jgi:hypothetical protein